MNEHRFLLVLLAATLAVGCTARPTPTAAPEPVEAIPAQVEAPTAVIVVVTATALPLPTLPQAAVPALCSPQVTANSTVNVRNGPSTSHSIIGSLNQGETRSVDAKNAAGTWWRIVYAGAADGHGWVAASVTTPDCIPANMPVISASSLPVPFVAAVTNVAVSVDPPEMNVPGCTGEIDWFTASATIFASGPMDVTYAFEIEGVGTTKTRTVSFNEYGSQVISERFKPEIVPGSHWVRLWIEGLNMKAWEYQTKYKIVCE